MKRVLFCLLPLVLIACQPSGRTYTYQGAVPYTPVVQTLPTVAVGQVPKNIILMIGDGMGLSQVSAAWVANRGALNLLTCPYVGLSRTYCANALITDSGAGGTALACGQKTNYGSVGCDTMGAALPSLFTYARQAGKRTAMSVVCRLCDATPADFCCHCNDRSNYDSINACYPSCGVDYIAGGGAAFLTRRKDGRNIISEMAQVGYHVYRDADSLMAATDFPVFACLADSEYVPAPMRGDLFSRQTMKAVAMMNNQPFLMMVEGSCIDDWSHANNLERTIEETLDFDRTVGEVLAWAAQDGQTLVVITADHETAGLTLLDGDYQTGRVLAKFASDSHSNIHVPVYAFGPGAERFTGVMENAELSLRLRQLL
ncbi:MAG: alkaline phosphatase [Paludibacteraceae bacterium]|nr:alkaline phosphatase [Paludibacteraceae bacterium]